LIELGHQLVREPDGHRHPRILACCDHREDPANDEREGDSSPAGASRLNS
jgi:hypothetical protein